MGMKKVSAARSCNFPTDAANFRQEIIGAQNFNFTPYFPKIKVSQFKNVAFLDENFRTRIFRQAKI